LGAESSEDYPGTSFRILQFSKASQESHAFTFRVGGKVFLIARWHFFVFLIDLSGHYVTKCCYTNENEMKAKSIPIQPETPAQAL
jgi:hypothetical protein